MGWEDPLEKGMATRSSILAWRIPVHGSQRVGMSERLALLSEPLGPPQPLDVLLLFTDFCRLQHASFVTFTPKYFFEKL